MNTGPQIKKNSFFILSTIVLLTLCCDIDKSTIPLFFQNPAAKIAVIADCHYYDPDLGTEGEAFETAVVRDRKMVTESEALLEATIQAILSEAVDIVLVAGDLTKDGELSSHQKVSEHFRQLEDNHVKVYVVPGNHDINNPHAMRYSGSTATPVPSVTAEQFVEIYAEFGFNEAIARDAASLTYIVEPVNGLWIFCMDCCQYSENTTYPVTGGKFSIETLNWIKSKLSEADQKGNLVLGMMHHGLLEHFDGQKFLFTDYVIGYYTSIWSGFAELGMNVVFTGHFHAQDIRKMSNGTSFIFDIETGSSVTYPCPYRVLDLNDERILSVESRLISNIDYDTNSLSFQQYAKQSLETGLDSIVADLLINQFNISADSARIIAPHLSKAIITHYEGDEEITPEAVAFIQQMNGTNDLTSIMIANVLNSIYEDPEPSDNDVIIDLKTGEVSPATGGII